MPRPVGVSAGAAGLVMAWFGGVAIAQLTGATPVVIVLAGGVILFVAALIAGSAVVRPVRAESVVLPPVSTVGDPFDIAVELSGGRRPVWVEVRCGAAVVASGWSDPQRMVGTATMAARGVLGELEVRIRSAGPLGLVWWSRRTTVEIGEHVVAPRPRRAGAHVERVTRIEGGDRPGPPGAVAGEIDGIRPWQEGDSERYVHWASSIRHGELVVHDRRRDTDERWVVRARSGTPDPEHEAGAARAALDAGLRVGADVWAAVGDGEPVPVRDRAAAARWSAVAELGPEAVVRTARLTSLASAWRAEPETTAPASARWWAAGATTVALVMLASALGYGPIVVALSVVAVAAGAMVSARSLTTGEPPGAVTRTLVALGALVALVMVAASSGHLDGLLSVLRGPLPQILIVLIALHGFESRDRRTIRVGVGVSAVVLMYASGFRVDGAIGWWLLAWAVCAGATLHALAGPTVAPVAAGSRPMFGGARAGAATLTGLAAAIGATMVLLAFVPVPSGPARLTLPTLIRDNARSVQPGVIAGPDGETREAGIDGDGSRAGSAGGYTGFAPTMDTSVRGDLGDQIVMRVRAPAADFWRGQTFSFFDGRHWYADDETGTFREGPDVDLPSAHGDVRVADDVEIDEFVQTFFAETDLPNVLFHAYRPVQVIVDADVWSREDGAIRASTTLPEGSIYTVVSARARVTEGVLRRQGLIGERLTPLGREALARYLEVPETTSDRTIELAGRLAAGQRSTYDTIRAYEAWLARNVVYDLDAPVPGDGQDAVDHFLFESRRGFCEQIASALAVMLRTQGVPARIATGYVSSGRDRIAGVYEVRASDAHAWVEVWVPEVGWQAFDPTASVPLAGDGDIDSVGADVLAGVSGWVEEHPSQVVAISAAVAAVLAAARIVGILHHRRRRGRWGLLQDRFDAAARHRGSPTGVSNPARVEAWRPDPDASDVAEIVAGRLDRVAFDPGFVDDDDLYADTRKLVGSLTEGGR